ncbi:hypothetical protein [Thermocrinis sp.]|uniref:hypothetical protein n=1 Tax=Thermocrinis sp. TaxID=2024383 RepID=UPI002FDD8379
MEGYIYSFLRRLEYLVSQQGRSINIILYAKKIKLPPEASLRISFFYLDIFEMLLELLNNIEFLEGENKKDYFLELALEALSLILISLPSLSAFSPVFADRELAKDVQEVVYLLEDTFISWNEEKIRTASQYINRVYQLLKFHLYSAAKSYKNMS